MFANLRFNPIKEIGELVILAVAILLAVFTDISFWVIVLIAFVLEIAYLLIYGQIEKKLAKNEPEEVKEEINFHEYDDDEDEENE
ncbi:MAG: hypothetical protein IJ571_09380 [Ruminococcus sp.]|nr:hypothetical protein [Ruminococcus sp.]